jgi:hypothetical protein
VERAIGHREGRCYGSLVMYVIILSGSSWIDLICRRIGLAERNLLRTKCRSSDLLHCIQNAFAREMMTSQVTNRQDGR